MKVNVNANETAFLFWVTNVNVNAFIFLPTKVNVNAFLFKRNIQLRIGRKFRILTL